MPPFHTPDEPAHLYRAYRVSEGKLDLLPGHGRATEALPLSLPTLAERMLDAIPFHPDRRIPQGSLAGTARVPLRPAERGPAFFPQALQYTFVPYVPQALAIAAGRLAGEGPLVLLYLARAGNLIFGTLVIAAALGLLPALRWWTAALMLTPMALAVRASASGDVMTASAACVLVAAAAHLCWGASPARQRDLALATASAVVLCACKAPDVPLALLPLLAPADRLPVRRPALWRSAHVGLVAATTAWGVATGLGVSPLRAEVALDPARQIRHVLAHPMEAAAVVGADLVAHTPRYLSQLIGKLGWQDTELPLSLRLAYLAVLVGLLAVDGAAGVRVLPWQRLSLLLLVLACLGLVGLSQYLVWTPVGASRMTDGIQGRYFFPPALAAGWLLHGSPRMAPPRRWLAAGLVTFVTVAAAVAVVAVWRRYYG